MVRFDRFARGVILPGVVACLFAAATIASLAPPAVAQFSIGDFQARPFVVGIIPVVGPRGAVGGVSIDARGAVSRSTLEETRKLSDLRRRALAAGDRQLAAGSDLRKVSLRGLLAELDRLRREARPLTDELQNVAGLTRIEYVLVYPEQHDLVLAGPAEAWQVEDGGAVVGRTTGRPILQLDDLIVALRTARKQPETGELITCSIDPTDEGSRRFARLSKTLNPPLSKTAQARLEDAIGPQQVSITGIAPGSHFAHVLVAADFEMKLLGMDLEKAPVDDLPSYLDLLKTASGPLPATHSPRWWMSPKYGPILRDEDSLAWQIRGAIVETLSEDGFQRRHGAVDDRRASDNSLAKKWADSMTAEYESLAARLPVFAELRNCMELAVVGALITHHDLAARADCDLRLLWDEKQLPVAQYNVPKTLASRASLVRRDREWIVSVSGGVAIDSWEVLKKVDVQADLADVRAKASASKPERWWWD